MKKLLVFIVFLGLLVSPVASAEVPAGVLGFGDGKFYDESQALKYMCFEDGNCYDLQGKFGFKRSVPAVAGITTPTTTVKENFTLATIPSQWFPRAIDDSPIESFMSSITCNTYTEDQTVNLRCVNGSTSDAKIKQVLFSPLAVRYEGDYQSVTDRLFLSDISGNNLPFVSSAANTFFYGDGNKNAKAVYTFTESISLPRHNPIKQPSPVVFMKAYNIAPSLVLININGKDVVYKVQ